MIYNNNLEKARKDVEAIKEKMSRPPLADMGASTEAINRKLSELNRKLYQGFDRVKNQYYAGMDQELRRNRVEINTLQHKVDAIALYGCPNQIAESNASV